MKIVVVTSITGEKDSLIEQHNWGEISECICFTDQPFNSGTWSVSPAHKEFTTPVLNAKRHKVLIHEYVEADYSLWIDGCIELLTPVTTFIERMKGCDIATFTHWLDCIYIEGKVLSRCNRDDPEKIGAQLTKYELAGFPKNYGLYCGGIILRKHTKQVEAFNEMWWQEICEHSFRDQISLPYVLHKTGLRMGKLGVFQGAQEVDYKLHQHQIIANWGGEVESLATG